MSTSQFIPRPDGASSPNAGITAEHRTAAEPRSRRRSVIKQCTSLLARTARQDGAVARVADRVVYGIKRASTAFLSDGAFLRLYYRLHLGRWPDLDDPVTFNEKIQWLKLNYRPSNLPALADKWTVREYVSSRVGSHILIPTYGVYDATEDVDVATLPNSFVLKPTHGSGWVIVCRDKSTFDWDVARAKLERWLGRNYYYHAREWLYSTIPPRIISEQLLLDERGEIPKDYKIFCFDGEPTMIQVDSNRYGAHTRDFYSPSWTRLAVSAVYPNSDVGEERPALLAEMLDAARVLSEEFPFCRVDFYAVDQRIYFGELTFYPANGIAVWNPETYDQTLGALLELPNAVRSLGH